MIKFVKRPGIQMTQGSGVSGQIVGGGTSTAGETEGGMSGTIIVRKIRAGQSKSGHMMNLNQRLRGLGRSVISTSD